MQRGQAYERLAEGEYMLTFALVVFVLLPAAGAVVLGLVMLFDRSSAGAQSPAAQQPKVRGQVPAAAPQQGLVAGMVARVTSPGMPRAAAVWAERTFSSGSQPRVAASR